MILNWYGDYVTMMVKKATLDGCKAAADHLANVITIKIAEPYPPASEPDEPPALRTGDLQASVDVILHPEGFIGWRVQTTSEYAGFLEFGTRKMEPRPFFFATLLEEEGTMAYLMRDKSEESMRGAGRVMAARAA